MRRMDIVELRSDTFTRPTREMLKAMAEAELGDDVWGTVPTANALQAHCAECHTGNYYTVSFNSRAVWLSKWSDGMTFGQHAAMRVAAETMPPPTAAAQPTEGERARLLDWVAAGMPAGACEPLTRPPLR